jgi:N-acetyl-alpha-D-glucosaminyl L-malate synthase BshA
VVKNKIEVIPNFVDLSLYQKDVPCQRSQIAPNGEKIVTHISNMRSVKRIPDIIDIFYRIQNEEEAILLMIGDGPEREKAEQQAKDLGIYSKVKFLGKTTEIKKLLCMSDLFLLTSATESFGLVALEAMAAKVPVISSNAGGIREVNVHGVTGYLATIGDVETMASYSLKLLQNPELHQEFRNNAYERAKEFSMDTIVPKYEEVYNRALSSIQEGKENRLK